MLFNSTILLDPFGDFDQKIMALICIGHFATAKTDSHFDLIATFQETYNIPDFDIKIMDIGPGPHLNLFNLDYGLLLLGLLGSFTLLVLKFSVIHHLADWRTGMRGNLNQIKTPLFSVDQCFMRIDNPDLLAGITDESDLGNPYLTINSYFFSSYGKTSSYVAFNSSFKWAIKSSTLKGSSVSPCLRKRGATVIEETS